MQNMQQNMQNMSYQKTFQVYPKICKICNKYAKYVSQNFICRICTPHFADDVYTWYIPTIRVQMVQVGVTSHGDTVDWPGPATNRVTGTQHVRGVTVAGPGSESASLESRISGPPVRVTKSSSRHGDRDHHRDHLMSNY